MGRIPTTRDPGHGGVRRRRRPRRRVVELEDEGSFAVAMQQAEEVRRGSPGVGPRSRQLVVVMIQVRDHVSAPWHDWVEYWTGAWRPEMEGGIGRPTDEDLIAEARRAGSRYARYVIRSTI